MFVYTMKDEYRISGLNFYLIFLINSQSKLTGQNAKCLFRLEICAQVHRDV